jgi:hypothetical protein
MGTHGALILLSTASADFAPRLYSQASVRRGAEWQVIFGVLSAAVVPIAVLVRGMAGPTRNPALDRVFLSPDDSGNGAPGKAAAKMLGNQREAVGSRHCDNLLCLRMFLHKETAANPTLMVRLLSRPRPFCHHVPSGFTGGTCPG